MRCFFVVAGHCPATGCNSIRNVSSVRIALTARHLLADRTRPNERSREGSEVAPLLDGFAETSATFPMRSLAVKQCFAREDGTA